MDVTASRPSVEQLAQTVAACSGTDETKVTCADTRHALAHASSVAGSTAWMTDDEASRIGPVDRIVAQLVVESGLAVPDEVRACINAMDAWPDAEVPSLSRVLIDEGYVTETQVARLEPSIEEVKLQPSIPGFELGLKIASGSSATVFRGTQVSLNRQVAIKVLSKAYWGKEKVIERLIAEGRAAAQLNHPNIVQAIDVGRVGDYCYFVMEFLQGETVHDLIRAKTFFPEAEALDVIIPIADALGHAHARGLVHRDVKPKNIVVSDRGVPKLADLGLARDLADIQTARAERGMALGTPYFISPEQVRGELHIGPEADIYSLGATLYYMLTGSVPFSGSDADEVLEKHLGAALEPANMRREDVSVGLSEVVEKMMAKRAQDRYRSCEDLLLELRAWRTCMTLAEGETKHSGSRA